GRSGSTGPHLVVSRMTMPKRTAENSHDRTYPSPRRNLARERDIGSCRGARTPERRGPPSRRAEAAVPGGEGGRLEQAEGLRDLPPDDVPDLDPQRGRTPRLPGRSAESQRVDQLGLAPRPDAL